MSLLALTLRQPAPRAFYYGKRLVNRDWPPPHSLVGKPLALHGGAPPTGWRLAEARWDWEAVLATARRCGRDVPELPLEQAYVQGIFAVGFLEGVVRVGEAGRLPEDQAPWFEGEYGWVLRDLVLLPEPVPCPGARKLWFVPDELLLRVRQLYLRGRRGAA